MAQAEERGVLQGGKTEWIGGDEDPRGRRGLEEGKKLTGFEKTNSREKKKKKEAGKRVAQGWGAGATDRFKKVDTDRHT